MFPACWCKSNHDRQKAGLAQKQCAPDSTLVEPLMPLADDPEAKKYILIYHDTENRNVFGIFLWKGIDSIDEMCYNKEKGGMEK